MATLWQLSLRVLQLLPTKLSTASKFAFVVQHSQFQIAHEQTGCWEIVNGGRFQILASHTLCSSLCVTAVYRFSSRAVLVDLFAVSAEQHLLITVLDAFEWQDITFFLSLNHILVTVVLHPSMYL